MALITARGDVAAQPNPTAPKIEFPCQNYVVKVVAVETVDVFDLIHACFKVHAPEVDHQNVVCNRSSKGRFVSYSFRIVATGETQLANLHKDLLAVDAVKMVM